MREVFEHLNINKKRIVEEKTVVGPMQYERYFFTRQEIEKLKKNRIPI